MFRVGRRVTGLCHWKVACIFIFLFSPSVRLSLIKHRNCFIFSCSSPFSPSSSREDGSTATQAIVTNLPHAYIPPCVPIKTNKQTKSLSDWWAASPVSWGLFSVSLAPQDNLVMKWQAAWADEQCLSTLKVSSVVFIQDKAVASLLIFYSIKYSYSNLLMYIITDICNSLASDILRINLLSAQNWFNRTLKRDSVSYCCRYFPQ